MKDVISVDTILNRIVSQEANTEGGWAEYALKEEDIKYGNPLHNQAELKKDLHSLLISKLPEKHDCKIEHPLRECFDSGWNYAIEDVKDMLDELFGSGDE